MAKGVETPTTAPDLTPPIVAKTCQFPNCGLALAEADKYYKEGFCDPHGIKAHEFLFFFSHPAIRQNIAQAVVQVVEAISRAAQERRQMQQAARSLIVPGRK